MSLVRLLPVLAAGLLAACSIVPQRTPGDTYLLPTTLDANAPHDTPSAPSTPAPHLTAALRVATPAASLQLNSTRIVVVPRRNELSVYEGARWSDPAPILMRNRLLDAFRADGHFAALSSDERMLHADLELDSELRAFQSEYRDGTPEAVIAVNALLVQSSARRIVASQYFEVREKASGTAVPQVVQAFGSASDKLARAVSAWAAQQAAVLK